MIQETLSKRLSKDRVEEYRRKLLEAMSSSKNLQVRVERDPQRPILIWHDEKRLVEDAVDATVMLTALEGLVKDGLAFEYAKNESETFYRLTLEGLRKVEALTIPLTY